MKVSWARCFLEQCKEGLSVVEVSGDKLIMYQRRCNFYRIFQKENNQFQRFVH